MASESTVLHTRAAHSYVDSTDNALGRFCQTVTKRLILRYPILPFRPEQTRFEVKLSMSAGKSTELFEERGNSASQHA